MPLQPASPVHAACCNFTFERPHAHSPLPNTLPPCTVVLQIACLVTTTDDLHRNAVQARRWAGTNKGLGMPRAKKKKLDAARDRLLKQADSADAENTAPQVDLEPAAAPPAAGEPTAADKLKQELLAACRKARVAGWIAGELQKDVQSAKRDQQLKLKVVGRCEDEPVVARGASQCEVKEAKCLCAAAEVQ